LERVNANFPYVIQVNTVGPLFSIRVL